MNRSVARVLPVALFAAVASFAQRPAAVTLAVEENANSPVVLHASVEPSSASGTVTFYSGTTILGIAPVRFGKADLVGAKIPPATQYLSAIYGGDLAVGRARSLSVRHVSKVVAIVDPEAIAVADFNGDGRDDTAVVNTLGNTVSIRLGGENGTFGPDMMAQTGAGPVALTVADFNGDGKADIATANRFGRSISVLFGRGDGTFEPPIETALDREPGLLVSGDFNGDGVPDLAFDGGWLRGGAAPVIPFGSGGPYRSLVSVDLNGDGFSDLAALKNGEIEVFFGQKDALLPQNSRALDAIGLTWGDLDGDGNADLVPIGSSNSKPSRTTAMAGSAYILSTADSGPGSLREAIQSGATNVTFGFNNTQITLTSGPIVVGAGVTIDGTGGNITISGNNQSRIFVINGDNVTIKGLTLANGLAKGGDGADGLGGGGGAAGMGGAVFVVGGANVKFDHVTFNNNKAQGGKGGSVAEGNSGVGSSPNGGGGGGGLGGNGGGASYAPFDFVSNDHGGSGGAGGVLGGPGGTPGYLKTIDTGSMIEIAGGFGAASTLMELSEAGSAFQLGLITVKAALTTSGVNKVKEIIGNFTDALTVITLTTYPGNGGPGAGGGGGGNYEAIGAPGGFGGGGGSAYWSVLGLARQPGSTAAHTHGGAGGFGGGQGGGTVTNGAGIGGDGYGGAVFVYAGTTIFDTCVFSNNTAAGGANGLGSFGTTPDFGSTSAGAAVYVNDGASGVYPTSGLPEFSNNTSALDRSAAGGFGQQGGNGNPVVLDSGDSGFGTLRWAVGQVSNGGTIRFGANLAGQTITLQSQLTLSRAMTIDGESGNVSISGNNQTRIFLITGGTPTLKRLTLKNGYAKGGNGGASRFGGGGAAGLGGAVLIMGGTVAVDTVTFTGNRAQGGSGGNGGSINYSAGAPANYGGGGGGGIATDGAASTATTGGPGGSGGDLGGAPGTGGPTSSFSVIASQNGGTGGAGAGGGGGASGTTQVSSGGTSTAVQKGGDGGTGGVGGGGGGAGYEVCAVTTFPSATCPSSPATARGGFGGLLGGGGGAGYKSGPGGMFGGAGGASASAAVGGGGAGLGGAICIYAGTLNLSASTFTGNTATGGSGAQRGQGKGGGLFFYPYNGATLNWVSPSTFSGNTAQDSTTNPTDSDQIYGATVNGAPAQITLTSTILQSQTFEQVLNLAPAGSIITFAAAMSGRSIAVDNALTINRDLTIDGTLGGAKNIVFVPGPMTGRAFCVTGGNFTLRNLTIANFVGNGVFGGANCGNGGGALRNDGGTVMITNVAFLSNGGPVPSGGAIYQSAGSMTLSASRFDGNLIANPADPGTNVAIFGGTLSYGGTNTFNVPSGYNAQTVYLLSGSPAQRAAVTTTVTTTDPTGPGSLEEAVTTAPSGSTIVFSLPDNSTITTNSELFIGGDLTIDGGTGVAISGNNDHRIFFLQSGKVSFKNLTLKNGLAKGGDGGDAYAAGSGGGGAGMGGAVFQNGGTLSLSNVTFASNNAKGGAGGSNLTLGDGRGFVSNVDYTRGGSGGGGATFKGDATNSGLPSGRSWARGGLGGMLIGENGGDGGKPSFGAQSLGSAGGFAAGGGGGGNDATAAGKGGAGGFGGGGGSAGAGPNPAHGAPGTFGGTPTAGMGGGGAGLGGGLFVRSGSVTFANVTFSNNRAAASGFPNCNTDVCTGFPDTLRGLGKGGGIFLNTGVSATALGPIEFSGNIADNAAAGSSFIVNEGNFYGNLLLPTNLRSTIGSFAANIGRPFDPIGITLLDQNGNPVANVPVTFTFPGGGASISGPPVVTATTGLNGVATFNLTANGTTGSYGATASVGSITLPLSFTNRAADIPNSFVVVAGAPQSAATGSTFATPIRILAKDASGNPVPYSSVKFYCCFAPGAGNVSTAGGTFAGGATLVTAPTDSNGEAVAPAFTANLFRGSYDAYVGNTFSTGATPGNGQALRLTNTAAPAVKITASAGTPQSAVYNTAFGAQMKALVTDANSIPVPNVTVTFSAPDPNTPPGVSGTFAGGGASAVATTDALGIATAPVFTANGNIGPYTVAVAGVGLTPASFSIENIPSATASIAAQSGSGQTATISTAFASPLTAIVRDSAGHPVKSATVMFTAPASGVAGATFDNGSRTMSVLTDANGLATVSVRANSTAGSYTITGTSPGATTSATYDLSNNPSNAAQISIVQGSSDSVRVLLSFQSTQRVKVTDNGGNAVSGVNVVFSLPASGASGTFPDGSILASVTTNSTGTADAPQVTANAQAGSYVMSATVPGLSGTVNFNFTNLVGQPESLTLTAGGNQSVAQGAAFPTRFTVLAKDVGGNLVPNASVLFNAPYAQPSGNFSGNTTATVNTDANGVATAPAFTAGTRGGSYQIAVTSGSAPILYINASNLAGAPSLISAVAGTGQTTTVLTAFPTALKVKATDNAGLSVSGATVTFTAPSTGPSLTFAGGSRTATATTDSNGEATAPAMTANGAAGSFGVTVSTGSVSVSYGYTNTAGAAAAASIYAGNNQSAPLSTSFTTPLQVSVTDASGNPLSNVNVTFAAPTTGAAGTFSGNSSTTVKTAATGIASATLTSNSTLGSYSVTATPSGLSALTFTETNSSPLVTSLTATSGGGQTAIAGGAFSSPLVANVTATPSSARANVSVTFTLPSTGASATFPGGALTATALTDSSGNATSPTLTANGTTGSFNVVVSVNALTASYSLQNSAFTAGTSSILLPSSSGSSSVQIAISGSFGWTASADQNWITFTTGSGTGSGTARFTYTANSSASPRTATITAGGVAISVTQAGNGYLQVRPVKRLVSGLDYSYAVAADPAGNVYYNQLTTFPNVDTYKWSAATGVSTKLPLSLQLLNAMAYDPRGNLVIGDLQTGTIKSFNLTTNALSTTSNLVGSDLRNPTGVAVNGNGDIFAIHPKAGDPTSGVALKVGGYQTTITGLTSQMPYNATDITGAQYVTTGSNIRVFNAAGQLQSTPISATNPSGVAVDGLGMLYWADTANGVLYQYNPQTAQSTALADLSDVNVAPDGFTWLQQVAVDASGLNVYFADSGNPNAPGSGAIWRHSTGYFAPASTSLSVSAGNGTLLYSVLPAGFAIEATSDVDWLTITSAGNGAINFTTASNTTGSSRTGHILVYGQSITVTQGSNSVTKTAGDAQSATVGAAFGTSLQVKVAAANGSAVSGASVSFTVTPGPSGASAAFSGSSSATATTNASGLASAPALTANTTAGTFTVTATSNGVSTAFTLTNTAAASASITAVAGTPQSTPVNLAFGSQFKATVKDANGNLRSGVSVTFAAPGSGASGTFAGSATVSTDSTGTATAPVFTANGTTGSYTVTASTSGVATPASFSLTNATAVANTITVSSGDGQSGTVLSAFANPLAVLVKNVLGNPIQGVTVTFTAPGSGAGAAFPNGNTAVTNASGIATSPTFNANGTVGSYTVTATAPNSSASASFTLTNTVGAPASIAVVSGTPQSVGVLTSFAALSVVVKDAGGNPAPNATVTFTAPPASSGASADFSGANTATATTNSSGVASVTPSANRVLGSYAVSAQVAGVASTVTFTLTNTIGAPASATILSGAQQTAPINTRYGSTISTQFFDVAGNPTPNVNVQVTPFRPNTSQIPCNSGSGIPCATFTAGGAGGTGGRTNAQGIFTTTLAPLANGVTGDVAIWIVSGSVTTITTFTNTAGAAASASAISGTPQSATVNTAFATALQAQVRDASNNVTPGVKVTFSAPSTGASATFLGADVVTTDSSGVATATIQANGVAGTYSVTATVEGLGTPVTFSNLTNTAGAAASIAAAEGSPQSTTVGNAFATALQARVTDSAGNPVQGATVTFAAPGSGASGSFSGAATAVTNASGVAASSTFTANTTAGSYVVTASVVGVGTAAQFSLTNAAGSAASLTVSAGSGQSAPVLTAFGTLLKAVLRDSSGNGIAGTTITFTAPGSGASGSFASGNTAVTDSTGVATASAFTANGTPGSYSVTAAAGALSATFPLTNAVGAPASISATGGTPQSATVGTAFGSPLQATVRDAAGNPVPNATVTFGVQAGTASATFGGSNVVTTNSSGVAVSPVLTANSAPGSYSATATVTGVTAAPAPFSLTNVDLISVTVTTSPAGLAFTVDGAPYTASTTFRWVPGTSHAIATTTKQLNAAKTAEYAFGTWSDAGAMAHTYVTPSSNPSQPVTANFTATSYVFQVTPGLAAAGSVVDAAGVAYPIYGQMIAAGSTVTVRAVPSSGYTFARWTYSYTDTGDTTSTTNPLTFVLNGPKNMVANFSSGSPALTLSVVSKSVAAGVDTWTVKATNSGQGTATAQITGITLTPSATVSTPLPISLGTIAPGGTAQASFSFNLPSSLPFTMTITLFDGVSSKTVTFTNLRL